MPDFTGPRTPADWPVPDLPDDVDFDWDSFDDIDGDDDGEGAL
jgi:hypothetical protein